MTSASKKRIWGALVAIALLLAAGLWFAAGPDERKRVDGTQRQPDEQVAALTGHHSDTPSPRGVINAAISPIALHAGAPAWADAFAARAAAGDPKAACRLGVQLLRCVNFNKTSTFFGNFQSADDDDPQVTRARNSVAARIERWESEQKTYCEGVSIEDSDAALLYLRQAAVAGEPEALLRYGRGDALFLTGFEGMQSRHFDRWRRESHAMIEAAVELGYPPALVDLMVGYTDDSTPSASLVTNDPIKATATRILLNNLRGVRESAGSGLAPDQERSARRLAEDWRRRYFSRLPAKWSSPGSMMLPYPGLAEVMGSSSGPQTVVSDCDD
jgi:hypothetical protein